MVLFALSHARRVPFMFYFPDRSLSGKYILQIENTVLKFSQIIPFRDVKYFDFAQIVVLVPRGDQD